MVLTNESLSVIQNRETLDLYIENLPPGTQLRFPSKTSSSQNYGVCTIAWDIEKDIVAIIPYIHKSFRKRKQRGKDEDPAVLARICILSELGLDIEEDDPKQIGSVFYDDDSSGFLKEFPKYTMLVTKFKGTLRSTDEVISEKNLKPVWVKRSLLQFIFQRIFTSLQNKTYGHSQLYAYERFEEYYERNYRW